MAHGPDLALGVPAGIQHGDVGSKDLVPREGVKVDLEQLDVDGAMRGICHAVDAHQGAGVVGDLGDGLDVVDGAQDVARVGAGNQPGLVRQQGLEVLGQELRAGLALRLPPPDDEALALGQVQPRLDVGLVVEDGDDNLVAGPELERVRQVPEQLGGGGAKGDLVHVGVDEASALLKGRLVAAVGLLADLVGGAELDVAVDEIVPDGVDDTAQDLAPAGVVHEDLVPVEGREHVPNSSLVERHGSQRIDKGVRSAQESVPGREKWVIVLEDVLEAKGA